MIKAESLRLPVKITNLIWNLWFPGTQQDFKDILAYITEYFEYKILGQNLTNVSLNLKFAICKMMARLELFFVSQFYNDASDDDIALSQKDQMLQQACSRRTRIPKKGNGFDQNSQEKTNSFAQSYNKSTYLAFLSIFNGGNNHSQNSPQPR